MQPVKRLTMQSKSILNTRRHQLHQNHRYQHQHHPHNEYHHRNHKEADMAVLSLSKPILSSRRHGVRRQFKERNLVTQKGWMMFDSFKIHLEAELLTLFIGSCFYKKKTTSMLKVRLFNLNLFCNVISSLQFCQTLLKINKLSPLFTHIVSSKGKLITFSWSLLFLLNVCNWIYVVGWPIT